MASFKKFIDVIGSHDYATNLFICMKILLLMELAFLFALILIL